jgi:hypothetical protein
MKKDKQFNKDDAKFAVGDILQEKQSFQRYLRESQVWQKTISYIGIAGCMILLGIFTVLVMNGLR